VHYRLCLQSANTHLAAARPRLGRRRPYNTCFLSLSDTLSQKKYLEIAIVGCIQKFVCFNITRDPSNTILFIIKVIIWFCKEYILRNNCTHIALTSYIKCIQYVMDLQNGFCHGLGNNYTIYTIYSIIKVGVIERYNISMYIEYLFCTIENIV